MISFSYNVFSFIECQLQKPSLITFKTSKSTFFSVADNRSIRMWLNRSFNVTNTVFLSFFSRSLRVHMITSHGSWQKSSVFWYTGAAVVLCQYTCNNRFVAYILPSFWFCFFRFFFFSFVRLFQNENRI